MLLTAASAVLLPTALQRGQPSAVFGLGTEPDETVDLEQHEQPEQEPWLCRTVVITVSPFTAGIVAQATSLVPQRCRAMARMGEEMLLPSSCAGRGHSAAGD